MQNLSHLWLELRIPAFHVITDLVRTNFTLRQNPVQPGPAQLLQTRVTGRLAMLPHVLLKQRIRPEFVGVTKFLRFLTSQVQNPCNGVIRNTPTLSWSWQLSQRRLQPELKKLARTQRNCMAIHVITAGHSAVAHAAGQIQNYSRVQRLPLFSTPGTPLTFQSLLL